MDKLKKLEKLKNALEQLRKQRAENFDRQVELEKVIADSDQDSYEIEEAQAEVDHIFILNSVLTDKIERLEKKIGKLSKRISEESSVEDIY